MKKKNEFEKMKNELGVKMKKKAKGPNPLSVKKKIQKNNIPNNNTNLEGTNKKKRTHKRRKKV